MGYTKDIFLQYRQEEVYRNERRDDKERLINLKGTKPVTNKKPIKSNEPTNLQN
jgi:hypothetical protein